MRGKRLIYIFLMLALLSVLLYFLWRQSSARNTEGANISLSFDLCLPADNRFSVIEQDNPYKLSYLRNAWIDSTRQFYAKTLWLPGDDTLFVSNWNQMSLPEGRNVLSGHSGEILEQQSGQTGEKVPYYKLFSRRDRQYLARYLFSDRRFNTLVLIDRYGRDSSAVRRFYEADFLLKHIQSCL